MDGELHSYRDGSWEGIEWGKYRNTGGAVCNKERVIFMSTPVMLKGFDRIGTRVIQFNPKAGFIRHWTLDGKYHRDETTFEIEDQELIGDNVDIFFGFLRKNGWMMDGEFAGMWSGEGI